MMGDPKAAIFAKQQVDIGPMERAVRKWDGDVFAGHEPEAWADLRSCARKQDAENERLRAQVARLRAAVKMAYSRTHDPKVERILAAALAETEEGA